jgi:cytochrome b561
MTEIRRYTAPARLLHWLTAMLVLAIAVLGIWITQFDPAPDALKFRLYNIHESLGIIVLVVVLVRLVLRRLTPPPPLPAGTTAAVRQGSHAVHMALYAILIAQPVIGFIGTNAWGFPLSVFYVLPLPAPVAPSETLGQAMSAIHFWLALALGGLLVAHLGGVVVHTFIWKDRLLRRML